MESTLSTQPSQFRVGLNNCDKEPVHIPGSIQPHGLMFAINVKTGLISHVSENCRAFLDLVPEAVIGVRFDELLDESSGFEFSQIEHSEGARTANGRWKFRADSQNRVWEFDVSLYKERILVEAVPAAAELKHAREFSDKARKSLASLQNASSLQELSQALVDEIHKGTQFDRVVLYRFDKQWNGHVIAEARVEGVDSYYDLHFPSTDIPKQVRELFCLNRLRLIPTTDYKPSKVVPNGTAVDMSLSTLRNVSPIHLEYLKNMKVKASMSVSILKDGELWGLISCSHEKGPHFVNSDQRVSAEFLTDTFAALLPVFDTENDFVERTRLMSIQSELLANMSNEANFVDGLLKNEKAFLDFGGATGGAVAIGDQWRTVGKCPEDAVLKQILEGLKPLVKDTVFVTNNLSAYFPNLEKIEQVAAGVAIFTTSQAQTNYFCWFRQEVIQTVKWGGDPNKSPELDGDQLVLHPRKSFQIWKEIVKRTALSWTKEEIDAFERLRSSIIEIVLQRVEQITKLNTDLERSNHELDSFAYAASHDMKEPLRGIHNYAAMILRDAGEVLPVQSKTRLQTILRLTQRSEDLINSLLHYAQIGRVDFVMSQVDLNEVIASALDSIRNLIDEHKVSLTFQPMPTVSGDRVQLIEVFTNLIGNAIKYNNKNEKRIDIGVREESDQGRLVIFVRDNGIGIDDGHFNSVFKIFKRLHGKAEFGGGSGTGLTITKKIIERHGGRIWIDSRLKEGTTFFFSLQQG